MSYAKKIGIYQGDCNILLGKYDMFSDYVKEFSKNATGKGLDLGSGPGGVNGKYFSHCELEGCDIEEAVVNSLGNEYKKKFIYRMGSEEKLPYKDEELDFVICSCVIQHLNSETELKIALQEIYRILKYGGKFYLMFKAGSHDTFLTHFNSYYGEERTFRVFDPNSIIFSSLESSEILMDENWIPYVNLIFLK